MSQLFKGYHPGYDVPRLMDSKQYCGWAIRNPYVSPVELKTVGTTAPVDGKHSIIYNQTYVKLGLQLPIYECLPKPVNNWLINQTYHMYVLVKCNLPSNNWIWLRHTYDTGWWFQPTPLKNMSSSVGVTIPNWMEQ